jgi:hypothetical protein
MILYHAIGGQEPGHFGDFTAREHKKIGNNWVPREGGQRRAFYRADGFFLIGPN